MGTSLQSSLKSMTCESCRRWSSATDPCTGGRAEEHGGFPDQGSPENSGPTGQHGRHAGRRRYLRAAHQEVLLCELVKVAASLCATMGTAQRRVEHKPHVFLFVLSPRPLARVHSDGPPMIRQNIAVDGRIDDPDHQRSHPRAFVAIVIYACGIPARVQCRALL